MDGLKVIASGDSVDVALSDKTKPQAMIFEGIGLEEGIDGPVVVLRKGFERITSPLATLRIEPDKED
jgi:hypothetical protein